MISSWMMVAPSNPILPKGSKLLSIQPAKTSSDEGGGDQSLPPPIMLGKTADENEDHCEQLVQTRAVRGLLWNLSNKQ